MANIALAVFLIVFGATMLVSAEIPRWFIGLLAVITGIIVGISGGWWKRGP